MKSTEYYKTYNSSVICTIESKTEVTFKVTQGAGIRAFNKGTAHFMPFTEYSLEKKKPEGGYDVYTGSFPRGFHYEAGGRGSGFLKQIQHIYLRPGLGSITITVDVENLDTGTRRADPDTNDDMYFNVPNDARHVVLKGNDTFNLMPIRVTQAQTSLTANNFIEPDYSVDQFGDSGAVALSEGEDSAPGCEYYALSGGNGTGAAVLRFTYGPLQWYKTPYSNVGLYLVGDYETSDPDKQIYFNATNPVDAGIVVVSHASEQDIAAAGIVTNIGLGEHDTVYFDRAKASHAEYTFKPTAKGSVTVRAHKPIHEGGAEWGKGWSDGRRNADGSFTVDLHEGRNIVEVGSSASTYKEYHVVNARGVKINIRNGSDPAWQEGDPFKPGETASVSFEGLKKPVEKIAGIYNPGYYYDLYVRYATSDGRTVQNGGAYQIQTDNEIKVPITGQGDLWLTGGTMPAGWLGSPVGSHRIAPGTPVYPNLNAAGHSGTFSALPDIRLAVGEEGAGAGGGEGMDYAWINKIEWFVGDSASLWYILHELDGGASQNVDLGGYPEGPSGGANFAYFTLANEDCGITCRHWLSTTGSIPEDGVSLLRDAGNMYAAKWLFGNVNRQDSYIDGEYLSGEKAGYAEFTVTPPEDNAGYDPRTYTLRKVLSGGTGKHPYLKNLSISLADRTYADYYSGRLKASDESGADLGLGWGFLVTRGSYMTDVPNNVQSVTVAVEPLVETDADGNSCATSVKVNGEAVTSATGYRKEITLEESGETVITVTATAQETLEGESEPESMTYKITVRKAGPPGDVTITTRDGERISVWTANGKKVAPDGAGKFSLPPAGGYGYALEKPGYRTRTGTFSVAEGHEVSGINLSAFTNSEKLDQTTGTAKVTIISPNGILAFGYTANYDALKAPDLASRGFVRYNAGGYTVLSALTEVMDKAGVKYAVSLGKATPDDTPEGGVYGSGWVCDVNGEVVADYANTLLKHGDDVFFYYNPNKSGQMVARFVPDYVSVKKGEKALFKLAGKPAGTNGELEPIEGATLYTLTTAPTAETAADGTAVIDSSKLAAGSYEVKAEYSGGGSQNILTNNSALLKIVEETPEPEEPPAAEVDFGDASMPAVVVTLPEDSVNYSKATGTETITVPENALTDPDIIKQAVELAEAAGGDAEPTIEIKGKALASDGLKKTAVEIHTGDLAYLVDETPVENVKISSAIGEVTMNKAAIEDLVDQAGGAEYVEVVIEHKDKDTSDSKLTDDQIEALSNENVREVYDVSLYADGEEMEGFKTSGQGKLTIGLPYSLEPGEVHTGVLVRHIREDGYAEPMTDGRKYDRTRELAIFETIHLSVYAVTYDALPDSGGGCSAGSFGVTVLFALAVVTARRRKGE